MTEVYSLLNTGFDPEALSVELHQYFAHHETTEVARIHAMLDLFASDHCLSRRLAVYFGDTAAPEHCGHCSVCAGRVAQLPEPAPLRPLDEQGFDGLCGAFIATHQAAKGYVPSTECLTRFLCGISVPLFTKLKARNISGFAVLEDYPYAAVREWARTGNTH